MKVRTVFHASVICAEPGVSLVCAAELMSANEIGSLAVYESDRLAGILTERDIVRAIADRKDLQATAARDYMSPDPVTASPEDDTMEVAERMLQGGFRHLPVVEQGRLVGMVSARDLLQVEAWPRAREREDRMAAIGHPARPVRRTLIEPPERR